MQRRVILKKTASERGSALVVAILIMVIMSLMGLAFALVAQTENKISINQRHQAQALFVAEGSVRVVKGWFDTPDASSGFLVPTPAQVNRTLRYVDNDGDGTYQLYSSAPAPWNVIYRSVANDLFEKPYRGGPSFSFEGTQSNPDLRISDTGSSAERSYLTALNNSLYPSFPAPNLRARVRQIDVYSPPILNISGQKVRYGIATVMVTVGVFDNVGTASEAQVGERIVKATLNEILYPGPTGPLQACEGIHAKGNFGVHWGQVTAVNNGELPSNIDQKLNSGVPWTSIDRIWGLDNNGDGTNDDFDADGQVDYNEWFSDPDNSIEDPWLTFKMGGIWDGGGTDDGSPNCQPRKFSPGWTNTGGHTPDNEHSNVFLHAGGNLCPDMDYGLWKGIARSGAQNTNYYTYDSGSGLFRMDGTGAATSFEAATNGRTGVFFFDTIDGVAPHDNDADGEPDNVTPDILISGSSWHTAGVVYVNARTFKTAGLGSVPTTLMKAPGEPYIDANGNGILDSNEYFLNITYPVSYIGNTYTKANWTTPATAPAGVVRDARGPARAEQVHMYGVLYTSGEWTASGDGIYYGAVVARDGVGDDAGATSGTWEIFFDQALVTGDWPPASLKIPRTYVTIWETDQ